MSSTLRSCLLALVVLNLVFVHITQAVSLVWIAPLYLAAAAAPLLWRLQFYASYQVLWNVGLLAIFALLLQHILYEGGVRYLLEDGLRLAAFCQVHILNNLGRQKKPDLIFFNSFLIAIVTSLFCQDLIYSIVFVVFAMVMILGLQVAATEVNGVRLSSTRFEVRSSLRRSTMALSLTLVVFVVWPRNFEREGLVEEQILSSPRISRIGFTEQIRLDNKGRAIATDTIVMRARLEKGDKDAVPLRWRGISYLWPVPGGWGGENRWQSDRYLSLDRRWLRDQDESWYREGYKATVVLEVDLIDRGSTRLCAPLSVGRMDIPGIAYPKLDGNFKLVAHWNRRHDSLTYRMEIGRPVEGTDYGRQMRSQPQWNQRHKHLADYLHLPEKMVPASADRLYESLRRKLPADALPQEVAENFARYLAANHEYLLPGEESAAQDLDEFLRRVGGGHCEYFASAMMILLRKHGIPCRMVGGFLAHEWDPEGTVLTIRKRHAHAWVEAWDENTGWFTVDATPARSALEDQEASMWFQVTAVISSLWDKVRSFDANARSEALSMLGTKLENMALWWGQRPLLLILVMALVVVLVRCYRKWRAPFVEPAVANYVAALRRAGVEPKDAETPRQLLSRARTMRLAPAKLEILALATAEHERRRYSSASTDAR